MKKYLLKKIIFLVTIMLFLCGLGVFLLKTEQGLRFGFLVASKVVSGKLVAQELRGCLLGPIDIEKFYFENKAGSVFANKAHVDWKIKELLSGKINITAIYADTIRINTKTVATNKQKLTLKDVTMALKKLPLPSQFRLGNLQLHNLSWQQDTRTPIVIARIMLQSHVTAGNIVLLKGELQAKDAVILLHGEVQKKWDINWKLHLPNLKKFFREIDGALDCDGRIYGERDSPEINANIKITHFKCANIIFAKLQGKFSIDLSAKKTSCFDLHIDLPKINSFSFNQLTFLGHAFSTGKSSFVFDMNIGAFTASFSHDTDSGNLKFEKGDIHGSFSQQGFFAKSAFLIAQQKPINIELSLPRLKSFAALLEEQPVDGRLTWETKNLNFLQLVLPNVKNISGGLNLKYTINGALQHPNIIGEASLTNTSLNVPELNIKLQNGILKIQNTQNKIEYQGSIYSGNGVLNLSGEALFSQNSSKNKVFINTTDFLVANTQEYRVIASSQLLLQTKDGFSDLSGKVSIYEATIKPGYLTYSGLLPTEIIYIKKETAKKTKKLNLHTSIQLKLGNKVYIDVSGLKGKVQGQMQLNDEPQKATAALGALYIKEGVYDFYGQQLRITKGELHFLGGAVINPEVDIEAIRDTSFSALDNKLIVGIKMHGLLERAKVDLFSVPSTLSKPDILSYLIIGKPNDQALGSKAQLLLQAASTVNFGGSGEISNLIGSFKKKSGFTEFGLTEETRNPGSGTKPDDSVASTAAFVLGRFLTPKIYVSYSTGILDPASVFRVKYYINKYWSLHSESSSLDNGADLFYTIERD